MMTRRLCLVVLAMMLSAPVAARADHPNNPNSLSRYIYAQWLESDEPRNYNSGWPDVQWYYTSSVPAAKKPAFQAAFADWSNTSSVPMPVAFIASTGPDISTTTVGGYFRADCASIPPGKIALEYQSIDGPASASSALNTLGYASTCEMTTPYGINRLVGAVIRMDREEKWYAPTTATNTAISSTAYDFWSVASQEVGHTTGWVPPGGDDASGHFTQDRQGAMCSPTSTARSTMCKGIAPGYLSGRYPSSHDRSATRAGYGYLCALCQQVE
jgi:hypothetical protein